MGGKLCYCLRRDGHQSSLKKVERVSFHCSRTTQRYIGIYVHVGRLVHLWLSGVLSSYIVYSHLALQKLFRLLCASLLSSLLLASL